MIQEITVGLLFLLAVAYIGRGVWKLFFTRQSGCAGGCSGCGSVDFKAIKKLQREKEA